MGTYIGDIEIGSIGSTGGNISFDENNYDYEIVEQSRPFVAPYTGLYIIGICGGGYGTIYDYTNMTRAKGSREVVKTIYLNENEVVNIEIGRGGGAPNYSKGEDSYFGNYIKAKSGHKSSSKPFYIPQIFEYVEELNPSEERILGNDTVDITYGEPGFGGNGVGPLETVPWGCGAIIDETEDGKTTVGHDGVCIILMNKPN